MERTELDEAARLVRRFGPPYARYPDVVRDEVSRRRWRTAAALSLELSASFELDGRPCATWVKEATAALYAAADEFPTGAVDADVDAAIDETLVVWAARLGTL